jgi:hypothetical protein
MSGMMVNNRYRPTVVVVTALLVCAIVAIATPFYHRLPSYRNAKRALNRIWSLSNVLRDDPHSLTGQPVTIENEEQLCPECRRRWVWVSEARDHAQAGVQQLLVQCEKDHRDGTRWRLFSDGTIVRR